jgi:hypothetical protein
VSQPKLPQSLYKAVRFKDLTAVTAESVWDVKMENVPLELIASINNVEKLSWKKINA